ncbi:glutathione S-transferase family protein [Novosphingobium humi]|uniref:glutathione S-transferase family protein n=1 Tax=Novosphingobium humi TaxID=2282397 RepID=UPI0025B01B63|nr:glutathione S-transferase family protein [Novosphingobium humi]WJS99484.1 glutathione S-transferase family protein [Novosphingobium humi]
MMHTSGEQEPPSGVLRMYHIPGCPFSERVEILLSLKGLAERLAHHDIDISRPRPDWLLRKTRGTTALPALELENGAVLKESMVILRYFDDRFPGVRIARSDPYEHAVEQMLCATDGAFTGAGYRMILNRDPAQRDTLKAEVDAQYARLDAFLRDYAPDGDFLFDRFGWAEVAFAPMFKRLWFLEYYEDYAVPQNLTRVLRWREACLNYPAVAEIHTHRELMTLYYDYAQGGGNGRIPPGRKVSSFTLDPPWSARPMPPRDKWGHAAGDAELGLIPA